MTTAPLLPVVRPEHRVPLVFATRAAIQQYRRAGGAGVLEVEIERAIRAGRTRDNGERRTVWIGDIEVLLLRVASRFSGRRSWEATAIRRRQR